MNENMTFTEIKQEELNEMLGEKPNEYKAARINEAVTQAYINEIRRGFNILENSTDKNYSKHFWTIFMVALALVFALLGVAVMASRDNEEILASLAQAAPQKVTVAPEMNDLVKLISEGQQNTNMLLTSLVDNVATINARPRVVYKTRYVTVKPKKKANRRVGKNRK